MRLKKETRCPRCGYTSKTVNVHPDYTSYNCIQCGEMIGYYSPWEVEGIAAGKQAETYIDTEGDERYVANCRLVKKTT